MDQKFHGISQVPINKSTLLRTAQLVGTSKTFLFEFMRPLPFELTWDWQKNWQKRLIKEPSSAQAVWLLQHEDCYTLGRGATEDNLLFDSSNPPCKLLRVDRGGEVTHHLPGQLVAYLALDLHRYKTDLDWYLRQLELVLIDVLKALDLKGHILPGLTGVWIENYKVGSIGIGCRRWVTQHGLALNVECDLTGFGEIIPCGLSEHSVGNLNFWIPGLQAKEVQPLLRECIKKRFRLLWQYSSVLNLYPENST